MATITRPVTKTMISSSAWGIPITDQVNANTTAIANTTPTVWYSMVFQNGWGSFGGGYALGQYRKIGDIVYLRGTVTGGTAGSVLTMLPTGFRPTLITTTAGLAFTGSRVSCAVFCYPNGNVTIELAGNIDLATVFFSVT